MHAKTNIMANSPYYRRFALIPLALIVVLSVISCSNRAAIDGKAPEVSFKTLKNEQPLELHQLGKPLLVNFWSTTCVICLRELPHLAEIYKEFSPRGFEMVAVAMPHDRPSDVLELSEARNWPFLVALDMDRKVTEAFGDIEVTPTSFLIDKNGEFVKKFVGTMDLDKFKQTLEEMTGT